MEPARICMSKTESKMVELGTEAPAFELVDVVSGKVFSRDDVAALVWDENLSDSVNKSTHGGPKKKHGLLVMFICVHCPYVKHVEEELARIGRDYEGKIGIVAISSNDIVTPPQDAPARRNKQAERRGFRFPYLYDESQEAAREYDAACTPDLFLFNGEMEL